MEWLETFLAMAEGIRMPEQKANAILHIAEMMLLAGIFNRKDLVPRLEQCVELCREAGYKRGAAMALAWLGSKLRANGKKEVAAAHWEESVRIARETAEPWVIAFCLLPLGTL